MANAPRALQFITITDKGDSFGLKEDVLKEVLDSVPDDMPVSVVCVVGAFRTGKSFILDLLLRYLRSTDKVAADQPVDESKEAYKAWMLAEGTQLEGAFDEKDHTKADADSAGFSWRPGGARNTTGMWIWSKPFIRRNPLFVPGSTKEPENIAVLLVDTQGMFDMDTTQMLTAAIFGLSTMVSSYLVYNVEKRVQEDNLQHLALFTEYGRIALGAIQENTGKDIKKIQPFQTLEFLVRDFQDYEDEDNAEGCIAEMKPYLDKFLEGASSHKDMAEVRAHIHDCFECPSVFMLPHPGHEVTKKTFKGDLGVVNPAFFALVHRLAISIFGTNSPTPTPKQKECEKASVIKKRVGERWITAPELFGYIKNYVKVFHEAAQGGGIFPEAKTLLAATAEANNYNAVEGCVKRYKAAMDKICGVKEKYVNPEKIKESHKQHSAASFGHFDRVATMGPKDKIVEFRERLETKLMEMLEEYVANNKNKRPDILRFIMVLLIMSAATYLSCGVINIFCWPPATSDFDFEYADVCNSSMRVLRDVYLTTFCFVLLTFVANCWNQIQPMVQMVTASANPPDKSKKE